MLLPQPLALPPRVLFGPRTCRMDALSSSSVTLRSLSNQTGGAALHATVEASDACSALRVARTIFFGQGIDRARAQLQLEQHAGQTSAAAGQMSGLARSTAGVDFEVDQVDLFDLMAWYCCAVDAAWACMQHFAAQVSASHNRLHTSSCLHSSCTVTGAGVKLLHSPYCFTAWLSEVQYAIKSTADLPCTQPAAALALPCNNCECM